MGVWFVCYVVMVVCLLVGVFACVVWFSVVVCLGWCVSCCFGLFGICVCCWVGLFGGLFLLFGWLCGLVFFDILVFLFITCCRCFLVGVLVVLRLVLFSLVWFCVGWLVVGFVVLFGWLVLLFYLVGLVLMWLCICVSLL